MPCEPGFQCGKGSEAHTPCALGTFAKDSRMEQCEECAPGTFQNQTGQVGCHVCPQGAYCERGAAASTPCPAGTYSGALGLHNASQCQPCPMGFYCKSGFATPAPCPERQHGERAIVGVGAARSSGP